MCDAFKGIWGFLQWMLLEKFQELILMVKNCYCYYFTDSFVANYHLLPILLM